MKRWKCLLRAFWFPPGHKWKRAGEVPCGSLTLTMLSCQDCPALMYAKIEEYAP